ncbi:hypothetical protein [Alkalibacterium sp. 20]|uniref:hypothetical protein n=1 Tax=Alkalibacterium sp. 20 TaxID=1798803 RepID=UPI0009003EC6|nr:hypothetical protein [Alkalibacterium sp. 20]OJF94643.1 hypothetical protein AX762_01905 [Alkalibacterium sp. 20]
MNFSYKTNQLIALLAALAAAFGWALIGEISAGLYIGIGVFLTWALSRELDSKHQYSAFIAAAFSLLNLLHYENVQLIIIFWILLLMRMVNGITGKELTVFDIYSVLGFTVYLSFNDENSVYLLIFLLAMTFITKTREKAKVVLIASGIGLAFFIVESFFMNYLSFNNIDYLDPITLFVIATLCLSFMLFWFLSKVETTDDRGKRVNRSRLLASQMLYSATVLLLFFFGDMSLNNLIIYISAILGVAIYFIGFTLSSRVSSD